MITHNTSVILRDSCAYASDFHWKGLEESKTIPVKAQIQPSQAAEFSSKAGNRWTGTAAGGAATSLEKLPRHVLQAGTPGQHCWSAQGLSSVPVDGWSHFREEPAWHFSQHCTLACFQDLLTVVEEKCIKDLFMFPSLTSLECAAGPVLGSSALPPLQQHLIAPCPC